MINDRIDGVMSLLSSAGSGKTDQRQKWYLSGDLRQMSEQEDFLKRNGFNVGRSDAYPVLYSEDDHKRALSLIFEHSVPGWWHYQNKYIEYGICTGREFNDKLGVEP